MKLPFYKIEDDEPSLKKFTKKSFKYFGKPHSETMGLGKI